ncbi:MAG: MnmC family methyltransferase [Polyangiales bacterium]
MSGCEVVVTESGALAMRDAVTGETMHPGVGPRVEAEALYVAPSRLRARLAEGGAAPLVLLDVGLGAGSNAVAALRAAHALPESARRLTVVSFEHALAPLALALRPEHAEAFGFDATSVMAATQLLAHGVYEDARVRWELRLGDLRSGLREQRPASADVVFWDPFSPRADPTLWSEQTFGVLRRACREGATVHTYSAAPATRVAMLVAGFFVGLGPRSGRKHKPTTIAATTLSTLAEPLRSAWRAQLGRSRVPLPEEALAVLAVHPQFVGG